MKYGVIVGALLAFLVLTGVAGASTPLLWTADSLGDPVADFSPEETVYIHGQFFLPDSLVAVTAARPDGAVDFVFEVTDGTGNFAYEYVLDGITGSYGISASDGVNGAETSFTDAAIWTTKTDCGSQSQDVNHYNAGDHVYINGDGFAAGNYSWEIRGKAGNASCDPNIVVVNGTKIVNSTGTFCFDAYTVQAGDCGEYQVKFGTKGDNYRIAAGTCGSDGIQVGEQCERPDTTNNQNCPQLPLFDCCNHRLGTRDALGDCDSTCGCVFDPFVYQCVKGQCGALCSNSTDCGNNSCSQTFSDFCNGTMLIEYDTDRILGNTTVSKSCSNNCSNICLCTNCTARCLPPTTNKYCVPGVCGAQCNSSKNCQNFSCSETYNDFCNGTMLAEYNSNKIPDNTTVNGSCSGTCAGCLCTNCTGNCSAPPLNLYCVKGVCGAQCSIGGDCSNSSCSRTYSDFCLDGMLVEYDHDRILDNTTVSDSCSSSCTSDCACTNCTTNCSAPPTSSYCVKNACGSQCSANGDCMNSSCSQNYTDFCSGHKLVDYNNNGIPDSVAVSDSCSNGCLGNCSCTSCTVNCSIPTPKERCVPGVCGAQCNESTEGCKSDCTRSLCGDGILDSGEECDDGNSKNFDGCSANCTLEACPPSGAANITNGTYLAFRTFDIGIFNTGDGSTINPSDIRPGFYAFMGEKIIFYVLVRDPKGKEMINLVKWVKDSGDEEGPCDEIPIMNTWNNGTFGGKFFVDEENRNVSVSSATNLQWDCQVDKVYKCVLTVEPEWRSGTINVEAFNVLGFLGRTMDEKWAFNPPLSVDITTSDGKPLKFGNAIKDQDMDGVTSPNCILEPRNGSDESLISRNCRNYIVGRLPEPQKECDISFSENSLLIRNTGVANLWPFIAASNFYASSGIAKCPFSNELSANQFEYRALMGTFDSGWRIMPQYSPNLGCNGLDLGKSREFDLLFGQCRGGCRIPTGTTDKTFGTPGLDILSPGQDVDVRLKIVWPTPCIGSFDDGKIYAIVRAV